MANVIEKSVARICLEMIRESLIDKRDYFIYKYNLLVLCEKVIAIIPVLVVSALLNYLLEMIIFIMSFASIRKYSGGYHCKSFAGCFVLSLISCMSSIPMALLFRQFYSEFVLLSSVAAIVVFSIGSINNPLIDWSKDEFVLAKNRCRTVCIVLFIVLLVLGISEYTRSYSVFVGMGLIQSSISLVIYRLLKGD